MQAIQNVSRYLILLVGPIHILNIGTSINFINRLYSFSIINILVMLSFSSKHIITKTLIYLYGTSIFFLCILIKYIQFISICDLFMFCLVCYIYIKEYKELVIVVDTKSNYKCPICLEEGDTAMNLPCTHKFHTECLLEWFQRKQNCPTCRQNFENFSIIIQKN